MKASGPPRLARSRRGAFEIDALMPDKDGVTLEYRGYDGVLVRTHFRFTSTGKSPSPPARLSEQPPKVLGRPLPTAFSSASVQLRVGVSPTEATFRHVAGGSMSGVRGLRVRRRAWLVHLQFKIGRFVQKSCGILGIRCCFSQPKQDRRLTHEVLFSDHVRCPRGIPAPTPLRATRDSFRGTVLQSELYLGDQPSAPAVGFFVSNVLPCGRDMAAR